MDYDATPSPTASPAPPPHPEPHPIAPPAQARASSSSPSAPRREASTILIDTATLVPEAPQPPTLEQNMAFAAFQQQQQQHEMDTDGS